MKLKLFRAAVFAVFCSSSGRCAVILALSFLGIGALSASSPVAAQAQYVVQPVAEIKVKQLPKGELFWRVESFPTLYEAKAAAPSYHWNPDTVSYDGLPSLTAEVAGKAWLSTLGPKGGATAGGESLRVKWARNSLG